MRDRSGEKGVRKGRRSRIRAIALRLGLVAVTTFLVWSVSGHVAADVPGSPACAVREEATTVEYLTGQACPPAGFAETMGYEPVLVQTSYGWRYTKPAWAGGSCSGPLADRGPFWNFTTSCDTHDYGYDLVRFGVGDRAKADGQFYRDMMSSCRGRGPACKALAEWARFALTVGDSVGMDPEPVVQP
jgi:hypothetical protein